MPVCGGRRCGLHRRRCAKPCRRPRRNLPNMISAPAVTVGPSIWSTCSLMNPPSFRLQTSRVANARIVIWRLISSKLNRVSCFLRIAWGRCFRHELHPRTTPRPPNRLSFPGRSGGGGGVGGEADVVQIHDGQKAPSSGCDSSWTLSQGCGFRDLGGSFQKVYGPCDHSDGCDLPSMAQR